MGILELKHRLGYNLKVMVLSKPSSCFEIKTIAFEPPFGLSCRFLSTVQSIQVVLMPPPGAGESLAMFGFRRIQITEQQTEKQRKNLLQKCLIFTQRARELQAQDPLTNYYAPTCAP